MRLLVLLSARATSPCRASVPGSRRGRAMEAAGEGMSRPARRATYPRWEVLLDLDEDALAGALLGGLDGGLFLTGRHGGDALGAAGIGQDLVAVLDVGEAVVEEGENCRRSAERRLGQECVSTGRSRWWP